MVLHPVVVMSRNQIAIEDVDIKREIRAISIVKSSYTAANPVKREPKLRDLADGYNPKTARIHKKVHSLVPYNNANSNRDTAFPPACHIRVLPLHKAPGDM